MLDRRSRPRPRSAIASMPQQQQRGLYTVYGFLPHQSGNARNRPRFSTFDSERPKSSPTRRSHSSLLPLFKPESHVKKDAVEVAGVVANSVVEKLRAARECDEEQKHLLDSVSSDRDRLQVECQDQKEQLRKRSWLIAESKQTSEALREEVAVLQQELLDAVSARDAAVERMEELEKNPEAEELAAECERLQDENDDLRSRLAELEDHVAKSREFRNTVTQPRANEAHGGKESATMNEGGGQEDLCVASKLCRLEEQVATLIAAEAAAETPTKETPTMINSSADITNALARIELAVLNQQTNFESLRSLFPAAADYTPRTPRSGQYEADFDSLIDVGCDDAETTSN